MIENSSNIPPEENAPEVKKRSLKTQAAKNFNENYVRPKKKPWKRYAIGGGVLLLLLLIFAAAQPPKGSLRFGVCKAFVELHDTFPQSLEWVMVRERSNSVTIDYNRTDAFGQRTLNQIRCFFQKEAGKEFLLERVDINGKGQENPREDAAVVTRFNNGVPALLKNPPSLILPRGFPARVQDFR